MRYLAIAAGLAFAVSTVPALGPAWAQPIGNPGAPAGGGGSGGGLAGVPEHQMNSSGKCWISDGGANYRWGDCPHVSTPQPQLRRSVPR
jgi:hypothetical protein